MISEIPEYFKCKLFGGFFDGDIVKCRVDDIYITMYKPLHRKEAFNLSVVPVTEKKYSRYVYRRIGETRTFEYFK